MGDGNPRQAKSAGYQKFVVYVSLGDPELHIDRVRLRVSQADTIFLTPVFAVDTGEALCALLKPYGWPTRQLCETNSGLHPVRMLLLRNGRVVWRADVLPEWVKRLSESLPKIELA
jgi:hypothetical protein